ncbi:NAD(P)-dependent dehydrogenase (short-subunit alcohol dehydrogenase family) [Stackebrandtia albiflava]|uniref:NAD(P)-dependent dehydrogenase (Short-subunit alcohol dehydrogenase family) n=1 Tax=Stackebrandtia albiflava TaxID=406432 RepID=A0A562VDL6_9ACTN|nr:SDR family oxidoreductase [Stackebrandtia albiflava]TWJ15955.1 NAD(P)-dependent dehydrogenase (short-subunit alcohol dehydrogenase family) [Stackebrandtia albiflava]
MDRFTGRRVLITGAARGIGLACARRLTSEGATVAVADIELDAATEAAETLPGAVPVECDVTDTESVTRAVAETVRRLGGLDVLVNNVGIAGPLGFESIDDQEWIRQTDPTLQGAARVTREAIPHLLGATGGGAVVSISSVNGMAAVGNLPYSAAKAGLINLTQNLAVAYGPRRRGSIDADHGWIRFNVVSPGTIRTRAWTHSPESLERMHRMARLYPMGRVGEPEDIAAAVAFLASPDAAWITGVNLPVEGGFLAGPATVMDTLTD